MNSYSRKPCTNGSTHQRMTDARLAHACAGDREPMIHATVLSSSGGGVRRGRIHVGACTTQRVGPSTLGTSSTSKPHDGLLPRFD